MQRVGIRNVGKTVAESICENFSNIDALLQATEDELCQVNGIGKVIAQSIIQFFEVPDNLMMTDRLKAVGLNFDDAAILYNGGLNHHPEVERPLAGLTFVLTGSLQNLTRDEAENKLKALGAKTSSSVSTRTSYVVAGVNAGSKLNRANELGVTVIDEAELDKLLGS